MIIYTPLCEMEIFPVNEEDFSRRKCVSYKGKLMYVEEMNNGSYQILQLLSTDPQDYLLETCTPGTTFYADEESKKK